LYTGNNLRYKLHYKLPTANWPPLENGLADSRSESPTIQSAFRGSFDVKKVSIGGIFMELAWVDGGVDGIPAVIIHHLMSTSSIMLQM